MRGLAWFMKLSVLGALLFWLPSIILHLISGERFSGNHVSILTALLPVLTLSALILALLYDLEITSHKFTPSAVLFGIWFWGPICMMIGGITSGGGFATEDSWLTALVATIFFPLFTFVMSTYDGTLGAVILTTLGLLVLQAMGLTLRDNNRRQVEKG